MADELEILARNLDEASLKMTGELGVLIDDIAKEIAKGMQNNLRANGSIDTGALYDSCRAETDRGADFVVSTVYADAKSEDGTPYAEFVEYGTGLYNEKGDGRQTPWKYQDREGNWHTTSGQTAKPFIRPAIAAQEHRLKEDIEAVLDISKYMRGG